jgi:hypothetical protein
VARTVGNSASGTGSDANDEGCRLFVAATGNPLPTQPASFTFGDTYYSEMSIGAEAGAEATRDATLTSDFTALKNASDVLGDFEVPGATGSPPQSQIDTFNSALATVKNLCGLS